LSGHLKGIPQVQWWHRHEKRCNAATEHDLPENSDCRKAWFMV